LPNAVAAERELNRRLGELDGAVLAAPLRAEALERFFTTPSGRERPGRFWRIDLETIAPDAATLATQAATVTIENADPRVLACDLPTAARDHQARLRRAFGATPAGAAKFGALAAAFAQKGAFVYVPADLAAADPIVLTYDVPAGASAFPYTVVLAERGSRVTVIERYAGEGAFVCGAAEVVAEAGAEVTFATFQRLSPESRSFQTLAARPDRDASVSFACAQLGGALAVADVLVAIAGPGVFAQVAGLFFPNRSQAVDVVTTVEHAFGDSTSETLVKSAAVDEGQARFLGNIRIAPKAQGSDANLRDDALLLSKRAHIDSVPALEIAANDVKAYHGATVGAIDGDQLFYMQSRGIERAAAERLIALGFFEPAVARFPTETLRDEIRAALEAKLR
jgi:Fe-S cluster assembly protein SufD